MYRQDKQREEVAVVLQVELNRMKHFCSEMNAVVNRTKIKITWFSLNNHIVKTLTPKGDDIFKRIEIYQKIKYLVIHFGRKM
jgi:hypothetical protein